MCIAIPVKIIDINGSEALAELEGVHKNINIDLVDDLKRGNYVLLHAGCAIQKVNEKEAKRTLDLMKKLSSD
ncbi:MAG: HypC/HybG/HupF family hydrogenase formation chaperone [Bacillota bacterium]